MENSDKSQPEPPLPLSLSGFESASAVRQYPPRLHQEGKSPIQNHSMNHYCVPANIGKVREELGDDVWSYLKNSSIGVFAKLVELDYTWAANRVHYFLVNQLLVKNDHEIWSLIDDQPLRFSLHEFETLTGLKCAPFDPLDVCNLSHEEFWKEMGLSIAMGPTYEEMIGVMAKCKSWSFDKRLMVAQLCFLSVAILGIHRGSRIPLDIAKRVLDKDSFEEYPWGRLAFTKLITSIKILHFDRKSYLLQGPVHVLLTWVYEHVPGIGETYGKRRVKERVEDPNEVPLLNWVSGRARYKYEDFISKEKAAHGKVRVVPIVHRPPWDSYPVWADEMEIDPLVNNMLDDILSNSLRPKAWSEVVNKKRKVFVEDKKDNLDDDSEMSSKKKKMKGKEHGEDPKDNDVVLFGMYKMMEKVTSNVDNINLTLGNRIDELAKKVEASEKKTDQENEFFSMFSKMKKFLSAIESKTNNEQFKEDEQ